MLFDMESVSWNLTIDYEDKFSGRSHGFRPGRGRHTALSEVVQTWKGTHWFVEGDISDCIG